MENLYILRNGALSRTIGALRQKKNKVAFSGGEFVINSDLHARFAR